MLQSLVFHGRALKAVRADIIYIGRIVSCEHNVRRWTEEVMSSRADRNFLETCCSVKSQEEVREEEELRTQTTEDRGDEEVTLHINLTLKNSFKLLRF